MRGIASYIRSQHLAVLALFFALGGTSVAAASTLLPANSVGTRQVINGSLRTNDLSKAARSSLKGSRGLTGPSGAQGASGATGARGAQGAQGAQGVPGQAAAKLFVALTADGNLSRSRGVTVAERAGVGVYRISFDTDVTNCVYLATGGQDDGGLVEDYHLYTSHTPTNTVNVEIFDQNNDPLDRPFHLAVLC